MTLTCTCIYRMASCICGASREGTTLNGALAKLEADAAEAFEKYALNPFNSHLADNYISARGAADSYHKFIRAIGL